MKILFQGDSLTDCGRARDIDRPNRRLGDGYVNMICGELVGGDPEAGYEIYNRAVSGNRIADMYESRESELHIILLPFIAKYGSHGRRTSG